MNQRTWKLPLPLLTILGSMFIFAFFFIPGSVAEAVCSDPSTATFYFPMNANPETNQGTGGAVAHNYEGTLAVDATPLSNVAGNTGRITFDSGGGTDSQVRFTQTNTRLNGAPGGIANVTYEFWFDVDSPTPRQQLFEVGSATRGIGIYVDNGTIHAGMWEDADASTTIDATESAFTQVAGVTANTAYHVIVVIDGTSITLAVDSAAGELGRDTATTATMDGNIASMGQQATIGNSQVGNSTLDHTFAVIPDGDSGLTGSIDEFAVYDGTSLATADIDSRFGDALCEPTAVTMSGIAASTANSLPYIAIAVLVLGTVTVAVLRRERVLN